MRLPADRVQGMPGSWGHPFPLDQLDSALGPRRELGRREQGDRGGYAWQRLFDGCRAFDEGSDRAGDGNKRDQAPNEERNHSLAPSEDFEEWVVVQSLALKPASST